MGVGREGQNRHCHVPCPLPCRLFEMGFAEQLQEIIARLPDCHQTVLFSATLPKLLVEFARAGEERGADGGWGELDLGGTWGRGHVMVLQLGWVQDCQNRAGLMLGQAGVPEQRGGAGPTRTSHV